MPSSTKCRQLGNANTREIKMASFFGFAGNNRWSRDLCIAVVVTDG